jgi:hypothetical protein
MKKAAALASCFLLLLIVSCANCPDCRCPEQRECPATAAGNCTPSPGPDNEFNNCPKITITKNITFTKYVCPDGRVFNSPDDCMPQAEPANLQPVLTNENGTMVKNVTVEPACIYGENGGIVTFKVGSIAKDIWIQVKTDGDYRDVYHTTNLYEGVKYFAISDSQIPTDFKLGRGLIYLMRVKFSIISINKTQYSNEHLVDARLTSAYMTKKCR